MAPLVTFTPVIVPVVVKFSVLQAKQIILTDDQFGLSHRIFGETSPMGEAVTG